MRYRKFVLAACALLVASTGAAAATEEQDKAKQLCIEYQNELVALETPALRDRLSQDPQQVAAGLEGEEITKIRRLIELDELLMFRCRIGLKPLGPARNVNGQTALQDAIALPDLPVRRPKVAPRPVVQRTIVPLPSRRSDAK